MAFYTGLPDGKTFDVLWEYLDASEDTLVTMRQLSDEQGKRSRGRSRGRKISLNEQLFITLTRLRRGMNEELLADLTLTSQSTISRLLATGINFLYFRLGSLSTWPSSEQVSHCLFLMLSGHATLTHSLLSAEKSSLPPQSYMRPAKREMEQIENGQMGISTHCPV